MKRRLVLLSIFSFLVGVSVSYDTPQEGGFEKREMWNHLNLHFSFLEEVLNPANCAASDVKFLGCIKTLNFLLSEGDKVVRLTTSDWLKADSDPEERSQELKIEEDLGFYKIVSRINLPVGENGHDLMNEYAILKHSQKVRQDYWTDFFKTGLKNHLLPIQEIEAWAARHHEKKHDLSGVIGEAYTVYLSSAEDAHAWIEPSESFELGRFKTEDDYFGTGISFFKIRSKLAVKSLLREGPAFRAGVRINDMVSSLNGHLTKDLSLDEVEQIIKKNKLAALNLEISRGGELKKMTIKPAKLKLENIESKILLTDLSFGPASFGYIRIASFMKDGVCQRVHELINSFNDNHEIKGIILDLRNNGGGIIDEAVCTAGLFLGPNQEIASIHSFDQKITRLISRVDLATNLPLMTLINRNSASASEILAGTLQDHGRSILVGERSFGKGSIQNVGPWDGHQGLHRAQTVARFYLPGNLNKPAHTNQIYGVYPDIEVYDVPNAKESDKFAFREADYSPIVLKEEGPEAVRPSPLTEIRYRRCTHDFSLATSKYQTSVSDGSALEDYPLLVTVDAMRCDLKQPAPTMPILAQKVAAHSRSRSRQ